VATFCDGLRMIRGVSYPSMKQESIFNELLTQLDNVLVFRAEDSSRLTTLSESLRLMAGRGNSEGSLIESLNRSPDSVCSIYLDGTLNKNTLLSLIESSFAHSDIARSIKSKGGTSFQTQIDGFLEGPIFSKKPTRKAAGPAEVLIGRDSSEKQRKSAVKFSLRSSDTADMKTRAEARRNHELKPEISNGYRDYVGTEASQESFNWMSIFLKEFKKNLSVLDLKLKGRVADAILDISVNPTSLKGDTRKPLTHDFSGKWRYRLGDYRLIYMPVIKAQTIYYLDIANRGSVYDV
jgi:mRNA-degrading endonuclease RelE of RelBE toxin-antitoxin system